MTQEEAASLLNQRLPAATAVQVLEAIDSSEHHVLGADGFLETDAGPEAKLDLIFDVSGFLNVSWAEKALFVRTFIANRAREGVSFEICAKQAALGSAPTH